MAGTYDGLQWKMSGGFGTVHNKFKCGKVEMVFDAQENLWKLLFYLNVSYNGKPVEVLKLGVNKVNIRLRDNVIIFMYKDSCKTNPMYYVRPESSTVSYGKLYATLKNLQNGSLKAPVQQGSTPLSEKQHTNVHGTKDSHAPKGSTPAPKSPNSPTDRVVGSQRQDLSTSPVLREYGKPRPEPSSASKKFLHQGQEKSQESIKTAMSSGNFYNKSATPSRSYGGLGFQSSFNKRPPGLLPTPKPKRARMSDGTQYSWNARSPVVASVHQTTLQGFSNLGNTCYMNAILQSLFGLDCFTTDLMMTLKSLWHIVHAVDRNDYLCFTIGKLLHYKKNNLNSEQRRQMLSNVKKAICSSAKRFSGNNQHDAHEFLSLVLDQLKEEIIKLTKELPPVHHQGDGDFRHLQDPSGPVNPTKYNFEMEVEHTFTCQICGEAVAKEETFHDLSLDVPRNRPDAPTSSIQDALDKFFLREKIEYTCEKCQGKEAEVSHSFLKLPRVLVLHLKRYNFHMGSSSHSKLGRSIVIPKFLTLNPHCTYETSPPHPHPRPTSTESRQRATASESGTAPTVADRTPLRPRTELGRPSTEPRRMTQPKVYNFKRRNSDEENRPRAKKDLVDILDVVSGNKKAKLNEEDEIKLALERSLIESRIRSETSDMTEEEAEELARAMKLSTEEAEAASTYQDSAFEAANQTEADDPVTYEMNYSEEPPCIDIEGGNYDDTGCHSDEGPIYIHGVANCIPDTAALDVDETFELHFEEGAEHECYAGNELPVTEQDDTTEEEDKILLVPELEMNGHHHENGEQQNGYHDDVCERCHAVSNGDGCNCNPGNEDDCPSDCDEQVDGSVDRKPSLWSSITDPIKRAVTNRFKLKRRNHLKSVSNVTDKAVDREQDPQDPEADKAGSEEARTDADVEQKTADAETDTHWDLDSPGATDYNKENHSPPAPVKLEKFDTIDLGEPGQTATVAPQPQQSEEEALNQAIKNSLIEQEMHLHPDEAEQIRQATEASLQDLNIPFGTGVDDGGEEEDQVPSPVLYRSEEEEEALLRNAETGELPFSYQLVSVVSHLGQSSAVGHYVSDVYDVRKKSWFSYDDTQVTRTTEETVQKSRDRTGYIFFYINKDTFTELEELLAAETDVSPKRIVRVIPPSRNYPAPPIVIS